MMSLVKSIPKNVGKVTTHAGVDGFSSSSLFGLPGSDYENGSERMMEIQIQITSTGNEKVDGVIRRAILNAVQSGTVGCKEKSHRHVPKESRTYTFILDRPLCVGKNNGMIGCPDGCEKYPVKCWNPGMNECYVPKVDEEK